MNSFFFQKYFYIVLAGILSAIFFTFCNDPFFGDAISSTSRAANYIYNQNLFTIFYPPDCDPAHPTLYPWLMAACWKLLGRTLFISHLYAFCWYLFLLFIFAKTASLFLNDNIDINKAVLLFIAMPTALSMSAMMLNTTAVMAFILSAVYALLAGKNKWFIVSTVLMMLTHMQAPFFLLALAVTDLFLSYKNLNLIAWFKKRFIYYAIPFTTLLIWLALHFRHTGWFVISPNYSDADNLNSISQFFKSIALMLWRLVDFGMITFYIIFVYAIFNKAGDKKLIQVWLILATVICCTMAIFLEKTIGHRYFLALGLLMIILVMKILQHFSSHQKNMLYLALLVSLVFGNLLYYPGKTIGDGTLAYRNYFKLSELIRNDFSDTILFYSYAPIANPSEFTHLTNNGLHVERMSNSPLDSLPALLQSNINAEFSDEDKKYLANNFYGKSYEAGAVYVNVFLNPKYYSKPEGWKLREPSSFENWMTGLKKKLKNE